jgi:hypothetical protein
MLASYQCRGSCSSVSCQSDGAQKPCSDRMNNARSGSSLNGLPGSLSSVRYAVNRCELLVSRSPARSSASRPIQASRTTPGAKSSSSSTKIVSPPNVCMQAIIAICCSQAHAGGRAGPASVTVSLPQDLPMPVYPTRPARNKHCRGRQTRHRFCSPTASRSPPCKNTVHAATPSPQRAGSASDLNRRWVCRMGGLTKNGNGKRKCKL